MAINKTLAETFAVDFWGPQCNCAKKPELHRHRIQKTFNTYKEAASFEKDVLSQVAKREYVRPSNNTVQEIADKWFMKKREEAYQRSTLENWRNQKDSYIIPSLGAFKVCDVEVDMIEKAAADWATKVEPVTVNKMLSTLTAMFAMAKRHKLRKDNPASEAERLKLATEDEDGEVVQPDEVYNKDELKKLIDATEPGSKDRIIVMLPALTGIRIGEELGAAWSAMDLKAGKFSVVQAMADNDKGQEPLFKSPKTKSSRRVLDLPQQLIRELKIWRLKCPRSERDLVLPSEDGKALRRMTISRVLDAAIEKAGLEKRLTPHGLRHTFASLLLNDGAPIAEVAKLMGHKNPAITLKLYTHFVKSETKSIQNLASSILG